MSKPAWWYLHDWDMDASDEVCRRKEAELEALGVRTRVPLEPRPPCPVGSCQKSTGHRGRHRMLEDEPPELHRAVAVFDPPCWCEEAGERVPCPCWLCVLREEVLKVGGPE